MAGSTDKKKPGSTTSLATRPRTDSTKAKTDAKRLDEEIDLEQLAEKIFQRLVFEARIERERFGWTV